ncbi:hypothetical protein [Actinomadura atramentaria]|uniref:hypothetical protein n=1 Tax=Actinomadura atramentaria TaxID=1990 RepID=UPI00035E43FA|nr:hypothetical protein [Actinomadura atramentaria]
MFVSVLVRRADEIARNLTAANKAADDGIELLANSENETASRLWTWLKEDLREDLEESGELDEKLVEEIGKELTDWLVRHLVDKKAGL